MARSRIVAVGRARSQRLVTNIVERLQRRGHEVRFYEDSTALAGNGLADADVLLAVSSFGCTRALMAPAENLRGVVSPTTGVEGFDIPAATDLGILVADDQLPENVDGMAEWSHAGRRGGAHGNGQLAACLAARVGASSVQPFQPQ